MCCIFAGMTPYREENYMTMRKFLIYTTAAILGLSATGNLAAQTKAETKLYNSVIAKGDLKNANKFLAKFPQSVYAPKVQRLKDSIVFHKLDANDVVAYMNFVEQNPRSYFKAAANTKIEQLNRSSITDAQAMEAALQCGISKESILGAKGAKNRNKEHILVILAPQNGSYALATLTQEGGNWVETSRLSEQVYTNDTELSGFALQGEPDVVTVNGKQYLFFSYTNSSSSTDKRSRIPNNNCELAVNLYSLDDNSIYNALFSGKMKDGILYGSTMESTQSGLMASAEQAYLLRTLKGMEHLKPYDKELFRTQETIAWWYENNPQNAGNLQFGIIPDNSELVQAFKANDQKEDVGQYTVAMFDICHNTVVAVYNKEDKVYSLALCQATPLSDKDLELNTFYGEKGNTLVLYYYQGKNAIKKRLNLGSKRMY